MSRRARISACLAAACFAFTGVAQAALTTTQFGADDGFGGGQLVGALFDTFGMPFYDPLAGDGTDQLAAGGIEIQHSYAFPSGGTVTGASIELVTAGWGLVGLPSLYINGVLVGNLSDGERDDGEYIVRDVIDLTPFLSQLQLDGSETVSIVAPGILDELDGGAIDFLRLSVFTQDDTGGGGGGSGGGTVPEPSGMALALAALAAAQKARAGRRAAAGHESR